LVENTFALTLNAIGLDFHPCILQNILHTKNAYCTIRNCSAQFALASPKGRVVAFWPGRELIMLSRYHDSSLTANQGSFGESDHEQKGRHPGFH
jgi:hypothetical protein